MLIDMVTALRPASASVIKQKSLLDYILTIRGAVHGFTALHRPEKEINARSTANGPQCASLGRLPNARRVHRPAIARTRVPGKHRYPCPWCPWWYRKAGTSVP